MMSENESARRVIANAAAVRVPISAEAAARVAGTVGAIEKQLADTPLELAFETEPSTFVVVQRTQVRS
jgi:hypothetical protein